MIKNENIMEISYIENVSDGRGRRVFIREGSCENVLWPGEVVQDQDAKLLGISAYRKQIKTFLGNHHDDK